MTEEEEVWFRYRVFGRKNCIKDEVLVNQGGILQDLAHFFRKLVFGDD